MANKTLGTRQKLVFRGGTGVGMPRQPKPPAPPGPSRKPGIGIGGGATQGNAGRRQRGAKARGT